MSTMSGLELVKLFFLLCSPFYSLSPLVVRCIVKMKFIDSLCDDQHIVLNLWNEKDDGPLFLRWVTV